MKKEEQSVPEYIREFDGVSSLPKGYCPAIYFWVDRDNSNSVRLSFNTPKLERWCMVEAVHIGLQKFLVEPVSSYPSDISFEWHFITALKIGIFIIAYSFSNKCQNKNCREKQVFRGWSIFDLRWLDKKCHKFCGSME